MSLDSSCRPAAPFGSYKIRKKVLDGGFDTSSSTSSDSNWFHFRDLVVREKLTHSDSGYGTRDQRFC